MSNPSFTPPIDRETLTGIVRLALDNDTLQVETQWRCHQIRTGGGVTTGGLYRLEGDANVRGQTHAWSVVLKTIRQASPSGDPTGWDYWKREVLAYSSNTLRALPGDVVAPRCYGARDQSPRETWLWLEDVKEWSKHAWTLEDFHAAARHLGTFNGSYVTGHPVPVDSWWSRSWLRQYVGLATERLAELPTLMTHPLIRRLFPGRSVDQLNELWAQRNMLLRVLDDLPQAFCHLDTIHRNLLRRSCVPGQDQTVLIDWASAGSGAVGQELAALVVGTILLYGLEPEALPRLERLALRGYLSGLRDAGWAGDEHIVRLGFAASAALRYTAYVLVRMGILLDDERRVWAQSVLGRPIEDYIDRLVALRDYLFALAAEALEASR